MTAAELADRLLGKPLTDARLLKLRRHLAEHPWTRPGLIDPERVRALLDAIEHHPDGGADARAYVHNSLIHQPTRTLPELPPDIAEKVKRFQEELAKRKEAQR